MYQVTNPATGEVVATYPTATDAEIADAIGAAHTEFGQWRQRPIAQRAAAVARAAELFAERAVELGQIITTEMGKLPAHAAGELALVSEIWAYYADHAEELLADDRLTISGGQAVIRKSPVGVVLGIMPWNYPYYQVARFAAPNLVLGNTILLKHAPSCPQSSAAIERLLHDAGVPQAAYINVYASNEQVSQIIADPRVQGVSLTGSERAGAAVAAEAGRHLKKVVLELGGSDPMIVLDSADVGRSAEIAAESRLENSGQACNAPKRMIVMADIYDEFVEKLTAFVESARVGDPTRPDTTLAPLSSEAAADRLMTQIDTAINQGAVLRTGGRRLDRAGAFVEPTVLTGVTPEMDAYRDELFGPVALVFRAESEDEAIALANDTPFGLGAGVFSEDVARAERVADRIEAGMVYINRSGGSQADLPFGGIKRSGFGRELGAMGITEFMNKKVIRY